MDSISLSKKGEFIQSLSEGIELIFKTVTHRTWHCPIRRQLKQVPGNLLLFWVLTLRFLDDGEGPEQVPKKRTHSSTAVPAHGCSWGAAGSPKEPKHFSIFATGMGSVMQTRWTSVLSGGQTKSVRLEEDSEIQTMGKTSPPPFMRPVEAPVADSEPYCCARKFLTVPSSSCIHDTKSCVGTWAGQSSVCTLPRSEESVL